VDKGENSAWEPPYSHVAFRVTLILSVKPIDMHARRHGGTLAPTPPWMNVDEHELQQRLAHRQANWNMCSQGKYLTADKRSRRWRTDLGTYK
jgi:hypothetical protein